MPRIVVIGGVAAGMSAASQAKRRNPQAEVIALERGPHVSYGACGMPYNIENSDRSIDDLVVITAEKFREKRGIDVRTLHEVVSIETAAKQITVRKLQAEANFPLSYDELVIATGALAFVPPIEGTELPGAFVLRDLEHGRAIKEYLAAAQPKRVVIVGAGYIGMEMAEVLTSRGLKVTVLEMMDQVIPGWHANIADLVASELDDHGVVVKTGVKVTGIDAGEPLVVHTDSAEIATDMVLVSVGVRPNVALARASGIELGASGAIAVDAGMRTSSPNVFAAGDCAEAYHLVAQSSVYLPLGDTANKQGKIAGANAAGANERFGGIVGSAGFKVFDLEVARTGLDGIQAQRLGLDAVDAASEHASVAHGYPGSKTIRTVVTAEKGSSRLLGAQMAGAASVGKRVDVFATALHAKMTIGQVEALDLVYAPPISPVYDPILIAATVTKKVLAKSRG